MVEILRSRKETIAYREHAAVRIFHNREAEDYPAHWHTSGEIIMPIDNVYTAVVDDTTHVLQPGDILVLPPCELHQLLAPASGERLILQFDNSLVYNLKDFDSIFHLLRPCCVITAQRHPDLHRELRALLLELKDEYFGRALLKEAALYAALIRFFILLGRDVMQNEHRAPQTRNPKFQRNIDTFMRICNYMNEHCTEDIQADELAEMAGFSKFHFTRLFKQYIGMSYYSYLNQHRIMHAEKLLVDLNLSVTEVAMRSGFGSLATFNRVFKSFKKCTPTQYKSLQDPGIP